VLNIRQPKRNTIEFKKMKRTQKRKPNKPLKEKARGREREGRTV